MEFTRTVQALDPQFILRSSMDQTYQVFKMGWFDKLTTNGWLITGSGGCLLGRALVYLAKYLSKLTPCPDRCSFFGEGFGALFGVVRV